MTTPTSNDDAVNSNRDHLPRPDIPRPDVPRPSPSPPEASPSGPVRTILDKFPLSSYPDVDVAEVWVAQVSGIASVPDKPEEKHVSLLRAVGRMREHAENADNAVASDPGVKQWHVNHAKRLEYLRKAWPQGVCVPARFIGAQNDCTGTVVIANMHTITKRYQELGLPLDNMWADEKPGSGLDVGLMSRHLRMANKSTITNDVVQAARREVQQEGWPVLLDAALSDLSAIIEEPSILSDAEGTADVEVEVSRRMEPGPARLTDNDDSMLQHFHGDNELVDDAGGCLPEVLSPVPAPSPFKDRPDSEQKSPPADAIDLTVSDMGSLDTDIMPEPAPVRPVGKEDISATITALRSNERLKSRSLYWCLHNALRIRNREGWCVLEPGFPTSDGQLGTARFTPSKLPSNVIFLLHHVEEHWSVAHWNQQGRFLRHYDSMQDVGRHTEVKNRLQAFISRHSSPSSPVQFSAEACPQQKDGINCGIFALVFIDRLIRGQEIHGVVDPTKLRRMYADKLEAPLKDYLPAPPPSRNVSRQASPVATRAEDDMPEPPPKRRRPLTDVNKALELDMAPRPEQQPSAGDVGATCHDTWSYIQSLDPNLTARWNDVPDLLTDTLASLGERDEQLSRDIRQAEQLAKKLASLQASRRAAQGDLDLAEAAWSTACETVKSAERHLSELNDILEKMTPTNKIPKESSTVVSKTWNDMLAVHSAGVATARAALADAKTEEDKAAAAREKAKIHLGSITADIEREEAAGGGEALDLLESRRAQGRQAMADMARIASALKPIRAPHGSR